MIKPFVFTLDGRAPPPSVSPPPLGPSVVLLFGMLGDAKAACEEVARIAGFRTVSARDLRSACLTLASRGSVLVIMNPGTRAWDRTVLEEHAWRAGAEIIVTREADAAVKKIEQCAAKLRGSRRPVRA